MRFAILFLTAIYLWWASMITSGRPPVEMWPTNTPTPARVGIWPTPALEDFRTPPGRRPNVWRGLHR